MKFNYLFYLFFCLLITSCGEDRRKEYLGETAADRWIYNTMLERYYWYKDMPSSKGLNFFTDQTEFFKSLLSKEDGKKGYYYSYIEVSNTDEETTRSILENSYGFDFQLYRISGNDTAYTARVLYTLPNSPAADLDLKRGDWICKVNDDFITQKNYEALMGGATRKLDIGKYNAERDTIITYRQAQIGTARTVEDTPILYYNVLGSTQGNVGYLVYNHFTSGRTSNDNFYDQQLLELSNEFKNKHISNFILDLRYNPGGSVNSAHMLSTILAPASAMGSELGYMEFNDRYKNPIVDMVLSTDSIQGGSNLNLSTLYILTTGNTASASELVAYCLATHMKVVVIGLTTEGKNVGSMTFSNKEEGVTLHPIVCKIYNSEGLSAYESGIAPNYEFDESKYLANYFSFGDRNEILLKVALDIIEGKEPSTRALPQSTALSPIYNSLERKSIPAVIINRPID